MEKTATSSGGGGAMRSEEVKRVVEVEEVMEEVEAGLTRHGVAVQVVPDGLLQLVVGRRLLEALAQRMSKAAT
ncbi:hypothetical protein EYF80_055082 [Liparis tanakae]|uniref:Uncharacterized protein n=1 Tax=Liparis tanakae TaxID=230148 RepID=A0A4Z2F0L5_9TELE|nr:hypothetical protein EYF80_055082 [Liparis tanakae]